MQGSELEGRHSKEEGPAAIVRRRIGGSPSRVIGSRSGSHLGRDVRANSSFANRIGFEVELV